LDLAAQTEASSFAHLTDQIVVSRLPGTVDLLDLHRLNPHRYPFLLQSSATTNSLGRYDILLAFPEEALELRANGELCGPFSDSHSEFLPALDAWWREHRIAESTTALPFSGGWFLYLGYELAAEIEPALQLNADPLLPTALAVRCPVAIIYDHEQDTCHFVAEDEASEHEPLVAMDIQACRNLPGAGEEGPHLPPQAVEEDATAFLDAVEIAKQHIADGDIYQANLSRQWNANCEGHATPEQLYARLRATNPAPFAGIASWNGTHVISSSPERLLQIRHGMASTRPIAGTRPRSDDRITDDKLSTELFSHPKERAEHIMLIDLERNDLGRICDAGSVEVDEMMVLESYAHVHHIVSNVQGRLRTDVGPGEAIRAVFPGGTITGCPKVRCMELINELENGPRGAYTGSFGYLDRSGNMDLNILIRTIVVRDGEISLRAGSGIVADSEPEPELAETRAKAKGLLQALSL
jgi:anthranilate synthase component 1